MCKVLEFFLRKLLLFLSFITIGCTVFAQGGTEDGQGDVSSPLPGGGTLQLNTATAEVGVGWQVRSAQQIETSNGGIAYKPYWGFRLRGRLPVLSETFGTEGDGFSAQFEVGQPEIFTDASKGDQHDMVFLNAYLGWRQFRRVDTTRSEGNQVFDQANIQFKLGAGYTRVIRGNSWVSVTLRLEVADNFDELEAYNLPNPSKSEDSTEQPFIGEYNIRETMKLKAEYLVWGKFSNATRVVPGVGPYLSWEAIEGRLNANLGVGLYAVQAPQGGQGLPQISGGVFCELRSLGGISTNVEFKDRIQVGVISIIPIFAKKSNTNPIQ